MSNITDSCRHTKTSQTKPNANCHRHIKIAVTVEYLPILSYDLIGYKQCYAVDGPFSTWPVLNTFNELFLTANPKYTHGHKSPILKRFFFSSSSLSSWSSWCVKKYCARADVPNIYPHHETFNERKKQWNSIWNEIGDIHTHGVFGWTQRDTHHTSPEGDMKRERKKDREC